MHRACTPTSARNPSGRSRANATERASSPSDRALAASTCGARRLAPSLRCTGQPLRHAGQLEHRATGAPLGDRHGVAVVDMQAHGQDPAESMKGQPTDQRHGPRHRARSRRRCRSSMPRASPRSTDMSTSPWTVTCVAPFRADLDRPRHVHPLLPPTSPQRAIPRSGRDQPFNAPSRPRHPLRSSVVADVTFDLSGRTVLVTGGTRAIGQGVGGCVPGSGSARVDHRHR